MNDFNLFSPVSFEDREEGKNFENDPMLNYLYEVNYHFEKLHEELNDEDL